MYDFLNSELINSSSSTILITRRDENNQINVTVCKKNTVGGNQGIMRNQLQVRSHPTIQSS